MDDKPSALALKLAERFAPKKPDAAKDIDNLIEWHGREERERIYRANKLLPSFCENVRVFGNANRNEFFELQLLPPEPHAPYEVQFKRYAVPGRYWIYGFQYHREGSGRLVYGEESGLSLAKSLKMVEADLDKPQVIDLFQRAFSAERIVCRYWREVHQLLGMLAPKSKVYRKTRKLCEQVLDQRETRIRAARAAKEVKP